jgi:hypothetical protein
VGVGPARDQVIWTGEAPERYRPAPADAQPVRAPAKREAA